MKIVCKLKREGGTKATIGSETYHFVQNLKDFPGGEHVAEVSNNKHLARFLSISEAYCLPGGEEPEEKVPDITDDIVETDKDKEGNDSSVDEDGEDGAFEEPNESMYSMMERDELASLVEKRTGQPPHHRTGKERLIETLQSLNAA